MASQSRIRADITALDRAGLYRISAEGFELESRYPINRMAKVLFDAGYRGHLKVYGPSAGGGTIIPRFSCTIARAAARQLTETSEAGFKFVPWTKKSLTALDAVVRRIPSAKDGDERPRGYQPTSNSKRRSLGKGIGGSDRPVTQDTGSHLAEVEVVL